MSHDEFAFFSRQLASMLKDGIPLESALKELCLGLNDRSAQAQLGELEQDLARGIPLPDALARRDLPDLFKRMVQLGARSNNLPGVLSMLADYYAQAHLVWTRLKGLIVYPCIVLVASLGLSVLLTILFHRVLAEFSFLNDYEWIHPPRGSAVLRVAMWLPPVGLTLATLAAAVLLSTPFLRLRLRWKVSPFRDASLSRTASAIAMMLRAGTPLPEALAFAGDLERGTPAGAELRRWGQLVASGQGKPGQWHAGRGPFPPLFYWLVQQGGEDLAGGFEKAAAIYQARAAYRTEMMLYGVLPVSVLLLGQVILWQVLPGLQELMRMISLTGGEMM